MKSLIRFFAFILCLAPSALWADGDLTSYDDSMGTVNNNNWNQMMNSRTPAVDFGNCNALILRCASPKCATGGCTSMDIATPIVSGCVMSNSVCKKYGDDLVQSIAAQIVANSTAKANAANTAAQKDAAQQLASQSAEQMQQMQTQMQQLQSQITEQNSQTTASIQAALDEQKKLAEQQQTADANKPATTTDSTVTTAVNNGVSAEVLAREQASGQIMSKLESAQDSLTTVKKTMQNVFDYAGCDSSGDNCTGPKRVKAFKEKANGFFEPYEDSLDEVYDALIMAQSLGVDITDIYMMLNGSCNVWGKYLCEPCKAGDKDCNNNFYDVKKDPQTDGSFKVSAAQPHCQLLQMLTNQQEVQQNWLDMDTGSSGGIRVACASDAIDNSALFRNRKKKATIDVDVLQRIISQDAPISNNSDLWLYCYLNDNDSEKLQKAVSLKKLPNPVCVKDVSEPVKESNSTGCDEANADNNLYINPLVSICTVHAYNIGSTSNPEDKTVKQNMNTVIALKTTIITQQMKKQYDYLETTIKRLRTQLEKAILTNKMEAAGAESSESSYNSGKSSNKNIILSGAQDCNTVYSNSDLLTCLGNNLNLIASSNDKTNARKQLESDLKLFGALASENNKTTKCSNLNNTNMNDCIAEYRIKIRSQSSTNTQKSNTNSYQNSNPGGM